MSSAGMTQRVVRRIRSMDEVPAGEPRRYKDAHGYMRLRWKTGPCEYAECFEHRFIMGFPDAQVHHKNRIRDDNRTENLEALSPADHGAEHRSIDVGRAAELYESGLSLPKVGEALGKDPVAVMRALKRDGHKVRTLNEAAARRRIDLDLGTIEKLMRFGVSDRRIANAYGVSKIVITARRKQLGITPRREGRVTNAEAETMDRLIAELVR